MSMELGQVGVWTPLAQWVDAGLGEAAAELDELGFGAIWLGNGPTIMDVAASIVDTTPRIPVATGIVNIWVHPVEPIAARYAEIAARHPDRLLLGLLYGDRKSVV